MGRYMVFFGRRGANEIVWETHENPVGVYEGNSPEEAMQKAAAHKGVMGAFFAVEGTFWGFTPGNTPTSFGTKERTEDKIGRLVDQISTLTGLPPGEVRQLTAGEIQGGDNE